LSATTGVDTSLHCRVTGTLHRERDRTVAEHDTVSNTKSSHQPWLSDRNLAGAAHQVAFDKSDQSTRHQFGPPFGESTSTNFRTRQIGKHCDVSPEARR